MERRMIAAEITGAMAEEIRRLEKIANNAAEKDDGRTAIAANMALASLKRDAYVAGIQSEQMSGALQAKNEKDMVGFLSNISKTLGGQDK